jgi:hypothetical protein
MAPCVRAAENSGYHPSMIFQSWDVTRDGGNEILCSARCPPMGTPFPPIPPESNPPQRSGPKQESDTIPPAKRKTAGMEFVRWFRKDGPVARFWNSPWAGAPMWLVFAYVCVWKWYFQIPATGKAIGALAVVAGIMSLRDIQVLGKVAWVALLVCMVLTEFRAIDKDRNDSRSAEDRHLKEERESFKGILKAQDDNFRAILKEDDKNFQKTISGILNSHKEDEGNFAGILQKQSQAFNQTHDLSEQIAGRLVPGDAPTPENACSSHTKDFPPGAITTIFGNNASVDINTTMADRTLLQIGDTRVIGIDQIPGSNSVALFIDFRDSSNRILLRMNRDGVVNRSDMILLHPSKSRFLVQDEYGNSFLDVNYINPHAFAVTGKAVFCGRAIHIMPFMQNSCTIGSGHGGVDITTPTCPMPQK